MLYSLACCNDQIVEVVTMFANQLTGDVLSPEELKQVSSDIGSGSGGSGTGSLVYKCICAYTVGMDPGSYEWSEIIPNITSSTECYWACWRICAYDLEKSGCEDIWALG